MPSPTRSSTGARAHGQSSCRTVLKGAAAGSALALWGTAGAQVNDDGELHVIAELVSKPDRADALRELLVPFATGSAGEPGCLEYRLMEVEGEPGRFLTYERWTDRPALDVHMTTP